MSWINFIIIFQDKWLLINVSVHFKACIFLPISVFASIWSYNVSTVRLLVEITSPVLISLYILAASILSPCPPLVQHYIGGYLMVACWIVCSCWFMRIRCLLATKLEKHGSRILFIYGCFTLLGQILGGIAIYICVDTYRLLKEKDACASKDLCSV